LAGAGGVLGSFFGCAGATGALATGAFADGAFTTGAFVATTTARLLTTEDAQTVTEVGPVFDEYAKPPDVEAEQAHACIGESW
jgi:hypothetical protein